MCVYMCIYTDTQTHIYLYLHIYIYAISACISSSEACYLMPCLLVFGIPIFSALLSISHPEEVYTLLKIVTTFCVLSSTTYFITHAGMGVLRTLVLPEMQWRNLLGALPGAQTLTRTRARRQLFVISCIPMSIMIRRSDRCLHMNKGRHKPGMQ